MNTLTLILLGVGIIFAFVIILFGVTDEYLNGHDS